MSDSDDLTVDFTVDIGGGLSDGVVRVLSDFSGLENTALTDLSLDLRAVFSDLLGDGSDLTVRLGLSLYGCVLCTGLLNLDRAVSFSSGRLLVLDFAVLVPDLQLNGAVTLDLSLDLFGGAVGLGDVRLDDAIGVLWLGVDDGLLARLVLSLFGD